MPKSKQQKLQPAVLSIQLFYEQAAHVAEETSTAAMALLDVVRYGALFANSADFVGQAGQDSPDDLRGAE